MSGFTTAGKPVDWAKDSQKYDIYTNEEGMHELLFSSQQPKAKYFRRHCCNVLIPHFRQWLANKYRKNINKPSKKKIIKYMLLNLQMKNINKKF